MVLKRWRDRHQVSDEPTNIGPGRVTVNAWAEYRELREQPNRELDELTDDATRHLVFECLEARAEGRYCECDEPDVPGVAVLWLGEFQCFMCGKCGLSHKDAPQVHSPTT